MLFQTHYGSGLVGDHLQWHVDSYNSTLHMAVALQGVRTRVVRLQGLEIDLHIVAIAAMHHH